MRRRLLVALLAIVAGATAAGCGGGDDEGGRDRAREREQREDREDRGTTTSEPTATSGVPDTPGEWVAVVEELWERFEALASDPDPARVRELYAEGCDCYEIRFGNVKAIADAGRHIVFDQSRPRVVSVTPVQTDQSGQALLTVAYNARPYDLLDADGKLVQHTPVADEAPLCASWRLLPDGPGGAYRIHSEEPLTTCTPEVGG